MMKYFKIVIKIILLSELIFIFKFKNLNTFVFLISLITCDKCISYKFICCDF